jgi:hypothetical protein
MAAFRTQQRRWVRGGAEVLRTLHRRLQQGTLPASERLTMAGHLVRHARQPYLLFMAAWLPLFCLDLVQTPLSLPLLWPGVLLLTLLSVAAYYAAARRRLDRPCWPALWLSPVVVALSLGLSLCLSASLLAGLFGRRAGVFVRTPKTGGDRPPPRPAAARRRSRDRLSLAETGIGAAYLVLSVVAAARGEWGAALFFLCFMAGGYLWVGAAR